MSSRWSCPTRRSAASNTPAGIDDGGAVPSGSKLPRPESETPVTSPSPRRSVRDTSAVCLARGRRSSVDLSFTPEEEEFRTELRSYLESTIPDEWKRYDFWESID